MSTPFTPSSVSLKPMAIICKILGCRSVSSPTPCFVFFLFFLFGYSHPFLFSLSFAPMQILLCVSQLERMFLIGTGLPQPLAHVTPPKEMSQRKHDVARPEPPGTMMTLCFCHSLSFCYVFSFCYILSFCFFPNNAFTFYYLL